MQEEIIGEESNRDTNQNSKDQIISKIKDQLSMDMPLLNDFNFPLSKNETQAWDYLCGMQVIPTFRYPCLLKKYPRDFKVQEVLEDGTVLPLNPSFFFSLPGSKQDPPVIHAIMVKKNLETFRLKKYINEKVGHEDFKMYTSGIKDKRAITSQRVAFQGIEKSILVKKLDEIEDQQPNVKFYKIDHRDTRIYPGTHLGNQFDVVLRGPKENGQFNQFNADVVQEYFQQQKGKIPNYFGRQRFGGYSPNGHIIGWYLIKQQPEEAMKIFIGLPTIDEPLEKQQERLRLLQLVNDPKIEVDDQFNSDNYQYLGFETAIAKYTVKNRDKPWKTLYLFSKGTNKMQIQSLASYVFNRYLQERMKIEPSLDIPIDGEKMENCRVKAPVIGYKIKDEIDKNTTCGQIISEIMDDLKINFDDFNLNEINHVWWGFHGFWRELKIDVENIKVKPFYDHKFSFFTKLKKRLTGDCGIAENIKIKTQLRSGQYFTSLIRNLFYRQ